MGATVGTRTRVWTVALVTTCLLAACTGGPGRDEPDGSPAPAGSPATPTGPAETPLHPPLRFDVEAGVRLPDEAATFDLFGGLIGAPPVALFHTTAYVATPDRLLQVDTVTGQVTTTVTPEQEPADDGTGHRLRTDELAPPALVEFQATPTVLAPFLVTVPGEGTTPAGTGVEIHAVAAADAAPLWSVELPVEAGRPADLAVVGVSGDTLVLNADGAAYGVDIPAGEITWQADDFQALVLAGGLAIGVTQDGIELRAAALETSDGTRRWEDEQDSYDRLTVQPGGTEFVVVAGRRRSDGEHYYRLAGIDSGSGDLRESESGGDVGCWFDGVGVIVCQWGSGRSVAAFDAQRGERLWSLPDAASGRVAPRITAVWHGAVYGRSDNGPLVLDARTGADRETAAGVAPVLVNDYVGIAVHESRSGLFAFPAVT